MTLEKFKSRLLYYKDSFTNEFPNKIVHSNTKKDSENKGWKVRKGWFTQLALVLELAKLDNLISSNSIKEVNALLRFVRTKGFNNRLTTVEDINRADSVINLLLEDLKNNS